MAQFDFQEDIKEELQRLASQIGFKISLKKDFSSILLDYLTVRFKLIQPKIRKIHTNPELFKALISHPKRKEIETIMKLALQGQNLNCFQSKRLLQSNFHDLIQQEWKIYHFHLSTVLDSKSDFVKQVDSLLFAYIDDENIAFLGIDKHRDGVFADEKWIEILHDKFPFLIEKLKDTKIKDIRPELTPVERQIFWNKGFTIGMVKVRDTVYHTPGLGRAVSGHSIAATTTATDIRRWIYNLKKSINENESLICACIGINQDNAVFKIRTGNSKLELFEIKTNQRLLEFPQEIIGKEELQKLLVKRTQII
jgi:hypothetical protein